MKNINDIFAALKDNATIVTNLKEVFIEKAMSLNEADEKSITWIKGSPENYNEIIKNTKAKVIVCNDKLTINEGFKNEKMFILTTDPKNAFINIINALFVEKIAPSIHPTAIIDKDAVIGKNVHIGPNVIIQKCKIGDNCVLLGNNFIFSNTQIGDDVIVNPGTVIGSDGYGYSRNADNTLEKFPHFGGVIIGDNVEIGANACIDRGTLGNTIIKDGVKIDNLVHVAHNVVINKNCLIIANTMIGGSTVIGENSWIAPSVSLMNGLKIDNNVTVGLGAVVTKNIPEGQTWVGSPAKQIEEFIKQQKKLKDL